MYLFISDLKNYFVKYNNEKVIKLYNYKVSDVLMINKLVFILVNEWLENIVCILFNFIISYIRKFLIVCFFLVGKVWL